MELLACQLHLQFDGLARKVERQHGAHGKFLAALQGAFRQRLDELG